MPELFGILSKSQTDEENTQFSQTRWKFLDFSKCGHKLILVISSALLLSIVPIQIFTIHFALWRQTIVNLRRLLAESISLRWSSIRIVHSHKWISNDAWKQWNRSKSTKASVGIYTLGVKQSCSTVHSHKWMCHEAWKQWRALETKTTWMKTHEE